MTENRKKKCYPRCRLEKALVCGIKDPGLCPSCAETLFPLRSPTKKGQVFQAIWNARGHNAVRIWAKHDEKQWWQ